MKESSGLLSKKCVPCQGGIPPMPERIAKKFLEQAEGWKLVENARKIMKTFEFKNFKEAMAFVDKLAELCESEGHHSDISIHYNKVELANYTHKINGLHENDFILAAKANKLL
mgnify:CR=1 FL=1